MNYNCGVVTFLAGVINDHRLRFQGRYPLSIWLSEHTIKDLAKEICPHTDWDKNGEDLQGMFFMNVPVHPTAAAIPYMRNVKQEMEVL